MACAGIPGGSGPYRPGPAAAGRTLPHGGGGGGSDVGSRQPTAGFPRQTGVKCAGIGKDGLESAAVATCGELSPETRARCCRPAFTSPIQPSAPPAPPVTAMPSPGLPPADAMLLCLAVATASASGAFVPKVGPSATPPPTPPPPPTTTTTAAPAPAALTPEDVAAMASEFSTPPDWQHHGFEAMEAWLRDLATRHPNIARLYSAGTSVQGRQLWVLEISDNVGRHEPGEPVEVVVTVVGWVSGLRRGCVTCGLGSAVWLSGVGLVMMQQYSAVKVSRGRSSADCCSPRPLSLNCGVSL